MGLSIAFTIRGLRVSIKYMLRKAQIGGASWIDETRISTYSGMEDFSQYGPSIAVDSSDYLHVVWDGKCYGYTGVQIWYAKYAISWADPVRISTYSGMEEYYQEYPSIAVDSNNYLHVVWHGMATGYTYNEQIWYAKYAISWVTPVRISTYSGMDGCDQYYSSIAVDSSNYLHVVWRGKATGYTSYYQIWYAKYTISWADPVRISTYSGMDGYDQQSPSIAVDSSNNYLHVVWHGKATGYTDQDKVWYAKYTVSWAIECLQATGRNRFPNARWSRHPSSNIPNAGVDYIFTEGTASPYDIYWDRRGSPFPVAPPTVTTQAVSSIEETTATGNGNIIVVGNEYCTKRGVCWNTTGNPTVADSKSEEEGSFGIGAFTRPMTGLSPGQHYYVKAYAYHSAGYGYGTQVEFTTKPNPPTSLWTKGTGAEKTMVRRKVGSYPTSVSDGDQAYFDTGNSFNDTSLSPATHYYYRAWSYKTGAPNSGYSDEYAQDDEWTFAEAHAPVADGDLIGIAIIKRR